MVNTPKPTPTKTRTAARVWTVMAALWMAALVLWVADLTPRALGWAPAAATASRAVAQAPRTFPCLSYAPFRRPGHSPFDPHLQLTREQIHEDLLILKPLTDCIRLYGVSHGQDQVPEVASGLGMQVVLGAWISRDLPASRQELQTVLRLAHQHPGVVRMIIVGNEVLLRQEQSPQDLALLLREARAQSPVPVGYADVWEFWLRHAAILRPEVDVAAVHILPYWEDVPVGLDDAVVHVQSIHRHVVQSLAPMPVWVAETGWPAQGRQRGPAVPGPREQALFVRELTRQLHESRVDFNLIEGFDQPWKRALEGAMGGAWGVVDAQGRLKDDQGGALPPNPTARGALMGLGTAVLLVMVSCALLWVRGHHRGQPVTIKRAACALWICSMSTAALLLGHHLGGLAIWLRSPWEWTVAGITMFVALWVTLEALVRGAGAFLTTPSPTPNPIHTADLTSGLRWRLPLSDHARMLLFFLFAWQALNLVFDGRYRPLPASLHLMPAVALCSAHGLMGPARSSPAQRLLAAVLFIAAPALMVLEGAANHQAWGVAMAWVLLGLVTWMRPAHGATDRCADGPSESDRAISSKAASNAAAADRSVS
jgi:glucan 1,3-beta-glucosidase